ncbi:MAG: HPr kinase/phosphorylase [Sedimentitalea sp.]
MHATCVRAFDQGLLIMGSSGSGKSSLALALMGLGAELVADDRVHLQVSGQKLIASCPEAISGQIEARGLGVLRANPAKPTALSFVLDLDLIEDDRLPQRRDIRLQGVVLPLLRRPPGPHLATNIIQLLKSGRIDV